MSKFLHRLQQDDELKKLLEILGQARVQCMIHQNPLAGGGLALPPIGENQDS